MFLARLQARMELRKIVFPAFLAFRGKMEVVSILPGKRLPEPCVS
jgi:hypothetical protein